MDWKRKLSSRKFWVAVSAFVGALCVLFGVDELTTERLVTTVSALGVMMAYILTEGYLDSKSISTKTTENHQE